jgi:hypothetical protein
MHSNNNPSNAPITTTLASSNVNSNAIDKQESIKLISNKLINNKLTTPLSRTVTLPKRFKDRFLSKAPSANIQTSHPSHHTSMGDSYATKTISTGVKHLSLEDASVGKPSSTKLHIIENPIRSLINSSSRGTSAIAASTAASLSISTADSREQSAIDSSKMSKNAKILIEASKLKASSISSSSTLSSSDTPSLSSQSTSKSNLVDSSSTVPTGNGVGTKHLTAVANKANTNVSSVTTLMSSATSNSPNASKSSGMSTDGCCTGDSSVHSTSNISISSTIKNETIASLDKALNNFTKSLKYLEQVINKKKLEIFPSSSTAVLESIMDIYSLIITFEQKGLINFTLCLSDRNKSLKSNRLVCNQCLANLIKWSDSYVLPAIRSLSGNKKDEEKKFDPLEIDTSKSNKIMHELSKSINDLVKLIKINHLLLINGNNLSKNALNNSKKIGAVGDASGTHSTLSLPSERVTDKNNSKNSDSIGMDQKTKQTPLKQHTDLSEFMNEQTRDLKLTSTGQLSSNEATKRTKSPLEEKLLYLNKKERENSLKQMHQFSFNSLNLSETADPVATAVELKKVNVDTVTYTDDKTGLVTTKTTLEKAKIDSPSNYITQTSILTTATSSPSNNLIDSNSLKKSTEMTNEARMSAFFDLDRLALELSELSSLSGSQRPDSQAMAFFSKLNTMNSSTATFYSQQQHHPQASSSSSPRKLISSAKSKDSSGCSSRSSVSSLNFNKTGALSSPTKSVNLRTESVDKSSRATPSTPAASSSSGMTANTNVSSKSFTNEQCNYLLSQFETFARQFNRKNKLNANSFNSQSNSSSSSYLNFNNNKSNSSTLDRSANFRFSASPSVSVAINTQKNMNGSTNDSDKAAVSPKSMLIQAKYVKKTTIHSNSTFKHNIDQNSCLMDSIERGKLVVGALKPHDPSIEAIVDNDEQLSKPYTNHIKAEEEITQAGGKVLTKLIESKSRNKTSFVETQLVMNTSSSNNENKVEEEKNKKEQQKLESQVSTISSQTKSNTLPIVKGTERVNPLSAFMSTLNSENDKQKSASLLNENRKRKSKRLEEENVNVNEMIFGTNNLDPNFLLIDDEDDEDNYDDIDDMNLIDANNMLDDDLRNNKLYSDDNESISNELILNILDDGDANGKHKQSEKQLRGRNISEKEDKSSNKSQQVANVYDDDDEEEDEINNKARDFDENKLFIKDEELNIDKKLIKKVQIKKKLYSNHKDENYDPNDDDGDGYDDDDENDFADDDNDDECIELDDLDDINDYNDIIGENSSPSSSSLSNRKDPYLKRNQIERSSNGKRRRFVSKQGGSEKLNGLKLIKSNRSFILDAVAEEQRNSAHRFANMHPNTCIKSPNEMIFDSSASLQLTPPESTNKQSEKKENNTKKSNKKSLTTSFASIDVCSNSSSSSSSSSSPSSSMFSLSRLLSNDQAHSSPLLITPPQSAATTATTASLSSQLTINTTTPVSIETNLVDILALFDVYKLLEYQNTSQLNLSNLNKRLPHQLTSASASTSAASFLNSPNNIPSTSFSSLNANSASFTTPTSSSNILRGGPVDALIVLATSTHATVLGSASSSNGKQASVDVKESHHLSSGVVSSGSGGTSANTIKQSTGLKHGHKFNFHYQEAFLTTYRTFIESRELINKLIYRYRLFSNKTRPQTYMSQQYQHTPQQNILEKHQQQQITQLQMINESFSDEKFDLNRLRLNNKYNKMSTSAARNSVGLIIRVLEELE